MKFIKTLTAVMLGLGLSAITSQAILTLNFSSTIGSTIQFNGAASSFTFNNSPANFGGYQWQVTSETGGNASPLGMLGEVLNGPFTYGPITGGANGVHQSANVLGPLGALQINDGLGNLPADFLTGNVNWIQVSTDSGVGGVNAGLVVNVTGLSYAGVNANLLALLSGNGNGSMDLAFTFNPAENLTQLTTGNTAFTTSYSGSIAVVPVPEASTVLAGALLLLPLGVSTLRILRRNRIA
jgi:hypothetical protein